MSLVSVIIPNYNHSEFLKERIDSVLNQSYNNFEVIILDDNSSDNSREIIDSYNNHEKIAHIEYNNTNSGSTFVQWKKGIELAKGNWIWIAESDDVAAPTFLEILLRKANQDDSQIAYCNSAIIDPDGNLSTVYGFSNMPSQDAFPTFRANFTQTSREFINWMLTDNFIPNASGAIFKKDYLSSSVQLMEINIKMKLMGDWYFWLDFLMKTQRISYISDQLNQFRNHPNNVRSRQLKNRTLEFGPIFNLLKKNNIPIEKSVSTFLFRYFNDELYKQFTFSEHMKVFELSIRYGFAWLYLKSSINYLRHSKLSK